MFPGSVGGCFFFFGGGGGGLGERKGEARGCEIVYYIYVCGCKGEGGLE